MMDFAEWVKVAIPKWSIELIQLGATWDTFLPFVTESKSTSSSNQKEEDSLINDLVKSGIPLLSARGIIAKVKDVVVRSKAPLVIFWDFDSIPIPSIETSTTTATTASPTTAPVSSIKSDDNDNENDDSVNNGNDNGNANAEDTSSLMAVLVRLKFLLSSYGSPITLRGYAENISNAITDEQRQMLSSYFELNLIDSSATVSGMDISTKRIIIDSMKLECNSTVTDSMMTVCFITADIDFSYLLQSLDRSKIFKIFISATESVKNIPDIYCNMKIDWENDILYPKAGSIRLSEMIERNKCDNNTILNYPNTGLSSIIKMESDSTGSEAIIKLGTSTVHMYVRGFEKEVQKDGKLRTKRGRCLFCKQKKTMHYCNHQQCSSQLKKCWLCINNNTGDLNKTCFALYHKGKF
jgi:hypothetical protein